MTVSLPMSARKWAVVIAALCMVQFAIAQSRSAPGGSKAEAPAPLGDMPTLTVVEWLQRMHAASRQRSYSGTFVVSAATGNLSSARIWHVCEGDLQMERIEALSGVPRSTFRRNDHVMTFLPEAKVVKSEKRENLELFPNLLGTPDSALADFYSVRTLGKGRVAGFDADVVSLEARDGLRFGYRVWSERRSGLVVKLQTVDGDGRVVEQSAFSELQLDAPVKVQALTQMMASTAGYRVEKSELERTTALAEGWTLKNPVA
ncbi:MAG: transcriptional regulator, partial [Comamonadaceae bacterium]